MRGDTLKPVAPVATALLLAGLMTTTVLVPPAAATGVQEEAIVAAGHTVTPKQETTLFSAAGRILRHIARARDDLEKGDSGAAERQLSKASVLSQIIEASLPTSIVKGHIWVAEKHLDYEDTGQVLPDLVAIYSSLDELTEYMPAQDAKTHLDRVGELLANKDKDKAIAELEMAAASLAFAEVDLPLKTTRRLVTQARDQIRQGDLKAAGNSLNAAEDNAVFLSVAIHDPLAEAHQSLWRAARDHTAGAIDAAKPEVDRAIRYLDYAADDTDEETRKAIGAISQRAQSLENQIEAKAEAVSSQLEELWRRTKALSERSVEYFTIGWQRLGAETDFKGALIEAKLNLSFAEIDRFTAANAGQAEQELGQAQMHLDQALARARSIDIKPISTVREGLKRLVAEQYSDQRESQYAALISRLGKLIETI